MEKMLNTIGSIAVFTVFVAGSVFLGDMMS